MLNGSRFSVVGDRAGDIVATRIEGTRVDARLSWRDDLRVDFKRENSGRLGVAERAGVAVPFSLVTSPLSWTNLEEREW